MSHPSDASLRRLGRRSGRHVNLDDIASVPLPADAYEPAPQVVEHHKLPLPAPRQPGRPPWTPVLFRARLHAARIAAGPGASQAEVAAAMVPLGGQPGDGMSEGQLRRLMRRFGG